MTDRRIFEPDLLRFLGELRTHNNKAWFERNRPRYERVYKEAFASFITEFGPRLSRISPYLVADPRPVGGSVMRIFRDTRFSKDKSPYRSYTVVHFGHQESGEGRAPGLFLYVAPDEISAGGGLWHPEPAVAAKIRTAIAREPRGWLDATASPSFRKRFELTGESLKRPPPGFARDHPQIAELMRRDFVASTDVPRSEFTSARFLGYFETVGRDLRPLLKFLCDAVGLPF
ncbi:MAG TPA: TIGR02453 family protein [Thermoplasmata archaeon]|nr:TIGR02453 family protein [Thermoplasmata archaeon]